jgi:hypothetical protein
MVEHLLQNIGQTQKVVLLKNDAAAMRDEAH